MSKNKLVADPVASDRLADAVENLSQRLQVVDDTISDILHELRWLLQNHVNVRIINRLPAEPADRAWSVKLAKLNPQTRTNAIHETIACSQCNIDSPDSLAAALQEAWINLQRRDGEGRNYVGLCPSCQELQLQNQTAQRNLKETDRVTPARATLW